MTKIKTLGTALLFAVGSKFMAQAQETSKIKLQSNFNSIELSANIPSIQAHMRLVNSVGVNFTF